MDDDKYKVRFTHFRVPRYPTTTSYPRRGSPEQGNLFSYSRQNGWGRPDNPNEVLSGLQPLFNYKRGRDIALGRALAYLEKKEDE
jgi:hypothetical protein